jgi:hypothetical protein
VSEDEEEPAARRARAWDDGTTAEELEVLARDPVEGVRKGVAGRAKTPVRVLLELASDADPAVRRAVARNERTPLEALRVFAAEAELEVADVMVDNPAAPTDVLDRLLARGCDRDRRERILGHANAPQGLLEEAFAEGRFLSELAANRGLPASMLRDLATRPDLELAWWVAGNPSSPPDVLIQLADRVRRRVLFHLPARVLGGLRSGLRYLLLLCLLPLALLGASLEGWNNSSTEFQRQDRQRWRVREALARNPATPHAVLATLAREGSLRGRVAENPGASPELRAELRVRLGWPPE